MTLRLPRQTLLQRFGLDQHDGKWENEILFAAQNAVLSKMLLGEGGSGAAAALGIAILFMSIRGMLPAI